MTQHDAHANRLSPFVYHTRDATALAETAVVEIIHTAVVAVKAIPAVSSLV